MRVWIWSKELNQMSSKKILWFLISRLWYACSRGSLEILLSSRKEKQRLLFSAPPSKSSWKFVYFRYWCLLSKNSTKGFFFLRIWKVLHFILLYTYWDLPVEKPQSKFSFANRRKPIKWRVSLLFTCEKKIRPIRSRVFFLTCETYQVDVLI